MRLNKRSALVLGALAVTTSASIVFAAGWRPPSTGSWQCFRADRFPDPAAERGPTQASAWDPAWAANDHAAEVFAEGLNKVARNSAVETVLAAGRVICVKY